MNEKLIPVEPVVKTIRVDRVCNICRKVIPRKTNAKYWPIATLKKDAYSHINCNR